VPPVGAGDTRVVQSGYGEAAITVKLEAPLAAGVPEAMSTPPLFAGVPQAIWPLMVTTGVAGGSWSQLGQRAPQSSI
jgi:hypothetical protein